jgi:hypothetical protein
MILVGRAAPSTRRSSTIELDNAKDPSRPASELLLQLPPTDCSSATSAVDECDIDSSRHSSGSHLGYNLASTTWLW